MSRGEPFGRNPEQNAHRERPSIFCFTDFIIAALLSPNHVQPISVHVKQLIVSCLYHGFHRLQGKDENG